MATIETDADVVRVIRENPRILFRALHEDPELLAEVRRLVLTEEVLAMPAQLAEVIERQDRAEGQLNQVIERQDRTEGRLAEVIRIQNALLETQNRILADQDEMRQTQNKILADQDEMRQTQNKLLETQNKLLEGQDEMRGDIKALHGMYRRQHDDLGRFRGKYAADAARKNDLNIARLFGRHRGLSRIAARPLSTDELEDMLAANATALDDLELDDGAWDSFQRPDRIVGVFRLGGIHPQFYIAIEASYTVDDHDVKHAADNAKILRCATGLRAYAAVAGVRISTRLTSAVIEDVSEYLDSDNEDAALWYALAEERMEPPSAE